MQYFRPELYAAFNSDDPETADQADEAWESAIADYRRHLKKIRTGLPPKVRELAERLCLHDAEYLGFTKFSLPAVPGDVAILSLKQNSEVLLVMYVLADEPLFSRPHSARVFETTQPQWLYDEVDVCPDGIFTHEILLSDGRILSLRFTSVDVFTPEKRRQVERPKRERAIA